MVSPLPLPLQLLLLLRLSMKLDWTYLVPLLVLPYLCIPLCLGLTSPLFPPKDRSSRPGAYAWIGLTAACVTSLLLRPGRVRIFLGTLLLICLLQECPKYTTGKPEEDYMIAINVVLVSLKYVDFVFLRTPEDTAFRTDSKGTLVDDAKSLRVASCWERLKWAGSLFSTFRGVGWNWRVKNVENIPQNVAKW
jgi:hypothetical protein